MWGGGVCVCVCACTCVMCSITEYLPPQSEAFRKPVPSKVVPDYYNVIKFPMDLQTMKEVRVQHDIMMM